MRKTADRLCGHCGQPVGKYMSINTAANLLDCSEQFFRNLVRDRRIRYFKIGSMVRIPCSELKNLMLEIPPLDEEVSNLLT